MLLPAVAAVLASGAAARVDTGAVDTVAVYSIVLGVQRMMAFAL
jgi:hypothetical protein